MMLTKERRAVLNAISAGELDESYATDAELEFLVFEISDEIFDKTIEISYLENPAMTFSGCETDRVH